MPEVKTQGPRRGEEQPITERLGTGMRLNRRQFIKAAMAAAVVANIPFTEAEAVEAYENIGIEAWPDGWYRCWMNVTDDGDTRQFSTYARAGKHSHMQLRYRKVRAWFDLEKGTLGKVEVAPEDSCAAIVLDGEIWGTQMETQPL